MPALTVFISSTFLEFENDRRELHRILTCYLSVACNKAEDLTCDTPDLEAEQKRWIEEADIVILLLGSRYGSGNISWTEKEVRYAKQRGKRILAYKKEEKPLSPMLELDLGKQEALESFVRFVEKEVTASIPRFSKRLDLVAMAVRDVTVEVEKRKREEAKEEYDRGFLAEK